MISNSISGKFSGLFIILLFLTACGGGSSSNGGSSSSSGSPVSISGTITFDLVPHNTSTNGLNYNAIQIAPARGIVVAAVNASNQTLASTITDETGAYNLEVDANTSVRIRAYAQMLNNSPEWDIQVTDNTNDNALYTLQGTLVSSGSSASERDLHADSGWGVSSYNSTRSAAPFAILDVAYESIQKMLAVDPNLVLPATEFRWSPDNRASVGEPEDGDIGTSYYSDADRAIYILGSQDNDTDEYDRHVLAHEFSHYLDANISRSDSIGGSHSLNERLDMRVAFGEGLANAFSGIFMDSPIYRDSLGIDQGSGAVFDISANSTTHPGWFSEDSVQSFIYAIYEDNTENFAAIFNTLTSDDYINSDAIIGVHVFGSELKQQHPSLASMVDDLAEIHDFILGDIWASTETNNGGNSDALPLYHDLSVNGSAVTVCTSNALGEYNKLNNVAYLVVDLPGADDYTISVTRSSGLASTDPDLWFVQKGNIHAVGIGIENNSEVVTDLLPSGVGVILVWDYNNYDEMDGGGSSCFNVNISN